jgi:hypothetical protein
MVIKKSSAEIESLYESGDFHVVQERSDFLLPQITDFVKKDRWINTRPEYQRRLVWDKKKKSRLIESLLMNIPVPPIFLFEHDLNRYEVMDGQQRLNSIIEFYSNELKLAGLDHWSVLNGMTYSQLPPKIQRGLDRRRVSATVLLNESGGGEDGARELRRQIFDRLNTGGQKLNAQELRNCLYSGSFNELLVELAGQPVFNDLWDIPRYKDHIRHDHISEALRESPLYKRMQDVEIVLRFFAFRGPRSRIVGAVKRMLDKKMEEGLEYTRERILEERKAFEEAIDAAFLTLGENAFRFPEGDGAYGKHSQPLYDAIVVSFDRLAKDREKLISRKARLRNAIDATVTKSDKSRDLFVGKANTAQSIRDRLDLMERAFRSIL